MPGSTLPPIRFGRLLTAQEAADHLSLSLRSIRRMIADGRLPIIRIGRSVRIRPEMLAALIEGE